MKSRLVRLIACMVVLAIVLPVCTLAEQEGAVSPAVQQTTSAVLESTATETATVAPTTEPELPSLENKTDSDVPTATDEPDKESEGDSDAPQSTEKVEAGAVSATPVPQEDADAATATPAPQNEITVERVEGEGAEGTDDIIEVEETMEPSLDVAPEGFDSAMLMMARATSACPHSSLVVRKNIQDEKYTNLGEEEHQYSYFLVSRSLYCYDCGETIQTVPVNQMITETQKHAWGNFESEADNELYCYSCNAKKIVPHPCEHENLRRGEDGNFYCGECGAVVVLRPEQYYCEHSSFTVFEGDHSDLVTYDWVDDANHLKQITHMENETEYRYAECNDCGEALEVVDGKVVGVGITDYPCEITETSALEAHTFEKGVCTACGYAQPSEVCSHANTERILNEARTVTSAEQIEGDATHHNLTTTRYYDLRCVDCKAVLGEETTTETTSEKHDMNEDGVCSRCGYGSGCPHNAENLHRYAVGDEYVSYSWTRQGDTHYVITSKVQQEFYFCDQCGAYCFPKADGGYAVYGSPDFAVREVSRYVEDCYMTNGWVDDYFSCMYCENTTKDDVVSPKVTITSPANNSTVSPDEAVTVKWTGTLLGTPDDDGYDYVFCYVIVAEAGTDYTYGKCFPINQNNSESEIPAGTFEAGKDYTIYVVFGNQSDFFAKVGAQISVTSKGVQTACDHSGKNYDDVLDESVKPVYSNITETTHCVQHSYKRYCKDCGAYIKNVVDEGMIPIAHDFSKGNTCDCGYQKVEEPEDAPYIRGFIMSHSSAKVGETVTFTLDIANVSDGEPLTIEFCADSWTESFDLTAPNNVFTHAFSQDGNRSIRFRVAGGDYCSAQVLNVESDAAKVKAATLSLGKFSIVEKAEGEIITAVVTCNDKTGIAELYVGDHYDSSSEYVVRNGQRLFTLQITLGGSSQNYAGNYKVVVRALKGAYEKEYSEASFGTLTVKHDTTTQREPAGSYYERSAVGHTLYEKINVISKCAVCGHKTSDMDEKVISKGPHSMGNDGKCNICGYAEWSPEKYTQEVERLRELSESVYQALRSGDNDLNKEYPNGFGGYGGKSICGVFAGLQARKLGFDYLDCNGNSFAGQPDGRDWCNYSRDMTNDWSSSKKGLGKDLEITNTVDGERYIQRIYLEKDAQDSCLYDLLAANNFQNTYNVIVSYSQKKSKTSSYGHVRYIYAILKDPSSGKWMVYFMDNMTSRGGVKEGKMVSTDLDDFIEWSEKYYYINGVVHFEPQASKN